MSPARALAADRPLRERALRDRNQRERNPNVRAHQPARGRSQQEIDTLVTEHLPLASFAVNAVAGPTAELPRRRQAQRPECGDDA